LADVAGAEAEYRPMVLVLGLCGLRFGECVALRVRAMDLMGHRLRVTEVNGISFGRRLRRTRPATCRYRAPSLKS